MEQYFTTKEVCALLKISRPTLWLWRKKKKIKFKKILGTIRYKLSDIEKTI